MRQNAIAMKRRRCVKHVDCTWCFQIQIMAVCCGLSHNINIVTASLVALHNAWQQNAGDIIIQQFCFYFMEQYTVSTVTARRNNGITLQCDPMKTYLVRVLVLAPVPAWSMHQIAALLVCTIAMLRIKCVLCIWLLRDAYACRFKDVLLTYMLVHSYFYSYKRRADLCSLYRMKYSIKGCLKRGRIVIRKSRFYNSKIPRQIRSKVLTSFWWNLIATVPLQTIRHLIGCTDFW